MRDETHFVGDIAQKVYLIHEDRVLLVLDRHGNWEPPGGRLNVGETPHEGLRRECMEELCVEISSPRIIDTFVRLTTFDGPDHFVVLHTAEWHGDPSRIVTDPVEVGDVKWVGRGEYDDLPMPDAFRKALDRFFGVER